MHFSASCRMSNAGTVIALAAAVLLAGCGGSDDSSPSTPSLTQADAERYSLNAAAGASAVQSTVSSSLNMLNS